MRAALKVSGLRKEFGGLVAVNEVSFEVGEGEFVGLIGPNGCGKSTTFNCISGLLDQTQGTVEVFGTDDPPFPHVKHLYFAIVAFLGQAEHVPVNRLFDDDALALDGALDTRDAVANAGRFFVILGVARALHALVEGRHEFGRASAQKQQRAVDQLFITLGVDAVATRRGTALHFELDAGSSASTVVAQHGVAA